MFGKEGIEYLLKNYQFDTVLDIGSGSGEHSDIFRLNGKEVTEIDFGKSIYAKNRISSNFIPVNYLNIDFKHKFDCIWACHVLEHQLNINIFLRKINKDLKENGILAITVPPLKDNIVGGHISLWNAGLLLYNLVLAGIDCKNASIKKYGYNITIILEKHCIVLPDLTYDYGDINKLSKYFPKSLGYKLEGFNGNITELNWRE